MTTTTNYPLSDCKLLCEHINKLSAMVRDPLTDACLESSKLKLATHWVCGYHWEVSSRGNYRMVPAARRKAVQQ